MKRALAGIVAGAALSASGAEISGNVTIASDYSFRGWSQTSRDPAIQGGFELGGETGLYLGAWMSNVKFGDDASTELDLYVGYAGELGYSMTYDVSIIRFEYSSEGDSLDYVEVAGSVGIGDLTLGVNYSPEYLGDGGETFYYPYVGYNFPFRDDMSLALQVGYNMADGIAGDDDSYIDYSAIVTIPFAGIDVGAGLVGTTGIDDDVCDADCAARLVVSFSKEL